MKKVLLALLVILTASIIIFAVGCDSNGPPTPIAKEPGPTTPGPTTPGPTTPGPTTPGPTAPPVVVNVLEITYAQNWSGLDLLDSYFHFAEDDVIEAKGEITAVAGTTPEFVFNGKAGAWGPVKQLTGIAAGSEFDFEQALTDTDITNIAAGSPAGIRIQGNNVTADTLVVVFEQIKVTRGSTVLLDLAEHLQTFNVDDDNMGLILPGSMGFQGAGGITVKVIAQ
jgi:hypothetical protein